MANLIIKPSAGGQLIIKDEGDSAAITVATNGTTTFAENATLSGSANNLGTVTTGSIGSAVTMPTGNEKLQVVYTTKEQVGTVANGGTLHYVNFTPVRQSTKQTWYWQLAHRSANMGALNALTGGHMYLQTTLYNNTDSTNVVERLSGYGNPPNMAQTYNNGCSGIGVSTSTLLTTKEYQFKLFIASSGAATANTHGDRGEYGPDVILIGHLWE